MPYPNKKEDFSGRQSLPWGKKKKGIVKPLTLLTGTGVFPLRKKGTERIKKKF